jgi:hypothetical protein
VVVVVSTCVGGHGVLEELFTSSFSAVAASLEAMMDWLYGWRQHGV